LIWIERVIERARDRNTTLHEFREIGWKRAGCVGH
jgi:hypothetical protein